MKVYSNGGWRDPTRGHIYVNGVWRTITRAMVYISGAWHTAVTFADPLTVHATANGGYVYGLGVATGSGDVLATPSGGLAPFTYLWTIAGSSSPIYPTIDTPTLASSIVFGAADSATQTATVDLSVTVTDAIGQTATDTCTVTFTNYWGY